MVPASADIAPLAIPRGTWHEDEFYGKTEIFTQRLNLPITVNAASKGASISDTNADQEGP